MNIKLGKAKLTFSKVYDMNILGPDGYRGWFVQFYWGTEREEK